MRELEVPLIELLSQVPPDARLVIEEEFSSTHIPVGSLCQQAYKRILHLEAQIDLLNLELGNEIDMENYEKHQRLVDIKDLIELEEIEKASNRLKETIDKEALKDLNNDR